MSVVTVTSLENLRNEVRYGEGQSFVSDEPARLGGGDAGPDPYTLLLAALGSCISMTIKLYARRKGWAVERVTVRLRLLRVHAKDCAECTRTDDGYAHRIERSVRVEGDLSAEQLARLHEIAEKCPVHRTLTNEVVIAELRDPQD